MSGHRAEEWINAHLKQNGLIFLVSLRINLFRELDHRLKVNIGFLLLWQGLRRTSAIDMQMFSKGIDPNPNVITHSWGKSIGDGLGHYGGSSSR
jgi:hypothetical protein